MLLRLLRPQRLHQPLCLACRAFSSAFCTTFPLGLTSASATASAYTVALDMNAPLLLRDTAQDFMGAARADAAALGEPVAAHLARAAARCEQFLDSGEVHDRDELRRALLGALQSKGQFALLLGGKSVGKSLLLRELARTDFKGTDGVPRHVVLINARECGTDLVSGLRRALAAAVKEGALGGALQGLSRTVKDRARNASTIQLLEQALKALQQAVTLPLVGALLPQGGAAALQAASSPTAALLDALLDAAASQGGYLCLLIDEGNLALPSPLPPALEAGGPNKEQQLRLLDTQALLHRLVALTKESRRINVLLCTSEYGYPYRLEQGNFFNTSNLTRTVFAGEVPPAGMRELLRGQWGLGPRLSDVFLAYYGGHVHMASQALAALAASLDAFDCACVAPRMGAASVAACLRSGGAPGRSLLLRMAQVGFAEVQDTGDAAAQQVARVNVGGLVDSHATVVGVPFEVRTAGGAEYGMVPSAQFTRHVICKALHRAATAEGARA